MWGSVLSCVGGEGRGMGAWGKCWGLRGGEGRYGEVCEEV